MKFDLTNPRSYNNPPGSDGYYAVSLRGRGDDYFLSKFVGGRWSHGNNITSSDAIERADDNAARGSWINPVFENLMWYSNELDLFDIREEK